MLACRVATASTPAASISVDPNAVNDCCDGVILFSDCKKAGKDGGNGFEADPVQGDVSYWSGLRSLSNTSFST